MEFPAFGMARLVLHVRWSEQPSRLAIAVIGPTTMAGLTVIEHPSVAGDVETAIRSTSRVAADLTSSVGIGHPLIEAGVVE